MRRKEIEYEVSETGCHVCTSHTPTICGYPEVTRNGKQWRMNRYVYTITNGEIPAGMVVRHTCDNRMCINPEHLILGSYADNNSDRAIRGRSRNQNGVNNNRCKLTNKEVVAIRSSKLSKKRIAEKYGIHINHIWRIRSGFSWKHI